MIEFFKNTPGDYGPVCPMCENPDNPWDRLFGKCYNLKCKEEHDGGKIQSVVSWSPGGCLAGGSFHGEDEPKERPIAPRSGLARTLCS